MNWIKILIAIVIALSALVILPTTMLSGSEYCQNQVCGVYFWGAHEHDGVWHLAVVEMIMSGMGDEMPTLSGYALTGYNTLLDWGIATISQISRLSPSFIYFKVIPLAWFVGMTALLLRFAQVYRPKSYFAPLLLLFSFLGSSFSFLIPLLREGNIAGASSLLSMQSSLALLNPQLALSLMCVVGYLILASRTSKSTSAYIGYGILSALALGLKFYTGVILLLMIAVELIVTAGQKKSLSNFVKNSVLVFLLPLATAWIVYAPSGDGGSPFILKPFATINPIIEERELVHIPALAIRLYTESGPTLLLLELVILVIFLVMNLGSRVVGIIFFAGSSFKKIEITTILIWVGALSGTILSVLLVQRGIWWNTVQFLHVALFLWGILAAAGLDKALRSTSSGMRLFVVATVLVTLVQNIDVAKTYWSYPGSSYISREELSALTHLRGLDEGIVFVPVFKKASEERERLTPLPEVYDTAYVTAYSGKQTYLADRTQLELLSLPYQDRLGRVELLECGVLGEVNYLYERVQSPYIAELGGCGKPIREIFANSEVKIYKVN